MAGTDGGMAKERRIVGSIRCAHGVRERTLVWWRSELKRRAAGRGAALVPVKVVASREQHALVELVLGSATLRFERGASAKQICGGDARGA